jgi:hypothetical protein
VSDKLWFTYGGENLATLLERLGVRFTVLEVAGAGVLGRYVHTVNNLGGDGARRLDAHLLERRIYVHYKLETLSPINHDSLVLQAEAEALINRVLHGHGLAELRVSFRDGYFVAEPDEVAVHRQLAHYQSGTITFVCPSPFLWGEFRTVEPSGGRVQVESNYFVEPVIVWTTDTTHGAPHIEVDGTRLTVDTQVSGGQQIRIDSARKETRVGGVLNVENIHGVYPRLFDGSTLTTSPGGDVTVQYQARWI